MTIHEYKTPIERDHITIDLGSKNYWISIVKEQGEYYNCFELALVNYIPPSSLLHERRIVCVPISEWYNPDADESELSIDLSFLTKEPTEAEVLVNAIHLATTYINNKQEK